METKKKEWIPQTIGQYLEDKGGVQTFIENESMYKFPNLKDEATWQEHARMVTKCANEILAEQNRQFVVDEHNRKILQFLLLYFNGDERCATVFPEKQYAFGKQILLYGRPGVGKTLLMETFSLYLKRTNNPLAFENISLTQMMNHFQVNNNIDRFTFNLGKDENCIEGRPIHLCLNDIGVKTHRHYGTDPQLIVEEFLYSRNDIYVTFGKRAHLTTNLDKQDMQELFGDEHERLVDRLFKTYNFIPVLGESRR